MTIKEFFEHVPLENDTKVMLVGNGSFNGLPIDGGKFIFVDKYYVYELEKDYELLCVSVANGHGRLCLEVDCR